MLFPPPFSSKRPINFLASPLVLKTLPPGLTKVSAVVPEFLFSQPSSTLNLTQELVPLCHPPQSSCCSSWLGMGGVLVAVLMKMVS